MKKEYRITMFETDCESPSEIQTFGTLEEALENATGQIKLGDKEIKIWKKVAEIDASEKS